MSAADLLVLMMAGACIVPIVLMLAWVYLMNFLQRGRGSPEPKNFLCALFLLVLFGAFVGALIHERTAGFVLPPPSFKSA